MKITPEVIAKMQTIPEMTLSPASAATTLFYKVDNSTRIFMRPVFNQEGGCCGQAAGIGYTFTYEINRLRNLDGALEENQYPTHFTWNFLNGGESDGGSWYFDGWDIVKQSGCPNVLTYGGMYMPLSAGRHLVWMTGYDKYFQAMHNRTLEYSYIDLSTPAGLETFKHWISNHNAGEATGGLGCFAMFLEGAVYSDLPPGEEGGKKIISDWHYNDNEDWFHAMTFVGYNDNIKYDINGDGQYTNDIDINGDGVVNMLDWEIGALKVVNSWGTDWPYGSTNNLGYTYIPYRLLAKSVSMPGKPTLDAIYNKEVYVLNVIEDYEPELTLKTTISHNYRSKISIFAAYAEDASKTNYKERRVYYAFDKKGGGSLPIPMQGINNEPIELGLDFNYFFKNKNVGKVFLQVQEDDEDNLYNGKVHSLSLIDYRWGEVFELPCLQSDVTIVNNGSTLLSIDYHLIPHEAPITVSDWYRSNRVSRFNPILANNANLLIDNNVVVDMYSSTITVNEGSALIMHTGSKFIAKRGTNKIIINGDIQMAEGVSFIAEGNATLEVILNNSNATVNFSDCNFTKCQLTNNASILNITNECEFSNCGLVNSKNTTTIEDSYFTETSIDLNAGLFNAGKTAIVRNCVVTNNNREGVLVENFPTYTIENNNIIGGFQAAVCIYNSGFGYSGSIVSNNYLHDGAAGIEIYASSGDLLNNKISNNLLAGAKLLHISNVNILGNRSASGSCNNTQYFYENTGPELYISGTSFPTQIRYNCFRHLNNSTPYVYYGDAQGSHLRDVRLNCWYGNVSNTPQFFYPTNIFEYLPTWCPTAVAPDPPNNPDRALYQSAENNEQNGNYSDAKTEYQSVVAQYPETDFAQASLKKLLNLEEFAGNDYASLQTYYNNLTDSSLLKLSDILANKCNERLGNWQAAIDWYKNVINNPPSFEDSIFSVIDLGYAHLMMSQQGGSRAAYMCTLPEHKPESEVQFFKKRNYLLSLLPGKESLKAVEEELPMTRLGEITDIVPNPASSNANVSFMLNNSGNVKLNIMSSIGKVVKIIEFGYREKGASQFGVDISELPSGMYLFKLTVNGNYCDTKKVIIAK